MVKIDFLYYFLKNKTGQGWINILIKVVTRDESGTDIIRRTDRPKESDTQMVRLYPNPDI
jgi:hypothetical protein